MEVFEKPNYLRIIKKESKQGEICMDSWDYKYYVDLICYICTKFRVISKRKWLRIYCVTKFNLNLYWRFMFKVSTYLTKGFHFYIVKKNVELTKMLAKFFYPGRHSVVSQESQMKPSCICWFRYEGFTGVFIINL